MLLLDADALIKLNHAGILELVAQNFDCVVPERVYYEVVIRGKELLYPDAESIERIVNVYMTVVSIDIQRIPELHIDAGESAVLALAVHDYQDSVIVSDDRRFLALLDNRGLPYRTPASLIVVMTQQGVLTLNEAREALRRLRPFVREAVYRRAMQELGEGEN